MICPVCKVREVPRRYNQKYCSYRCSRKHVSEQSKKYNEEIIKPRNSKIAEIEAFIICNYTLQNVTDKAKAWDNIVQMWLGDKNDLS
ncbi:MAG TPA: hypothetical protein VMZ91_11985 [Candidatus Paceibacterota bacterium]|nr:hypothetical protein [Candidatus Paceibacterota bacterium]